MDLKEIIRDVPDFPKPGIIFKDITPLLQNGEAFVAVTEAFRERYQNEPLDAIVSIESRGFIFGAALAHALKKGLVLARKKGKLPWKTVEQTYALEYGTDTIEVHEDGIHPGARILLIDDVLATGGTARAACELIEKVGGEVLECAFLMELEFLKGRERLQGRGVFSLVQY